jgi:predicted DNA-binding protein
MEHHMTNITRLSIPLKKETRRKLKALAEVQSSSLASVITELLDACADEVYELAQTLKLAKQSPAAAKRRMSEAFEKKLAEADQYRLDLEPKPVKATKKKTG